MPNYYDPTDAIMHNLDSRNWPSSLNDCLVYVRYDGGDPYHSDDQEFARIEYDGNGVKSRAFVIRNRKECELTDLSSDGLAHRIEMWGRCIPKEDYESLLSLPTSAHEAFRILDLMISEEDREFILSLSKAEFSIREHFWLGLWIRNNWINSVDDDNPDEKERHEKCLRMLSGVKKGYFIMDSPDTISSMFLERYYDHLVRLKK